MKPIHYFGYGAMANPVIVTALLGRLPKNTGVFGGSPRLSGWSLAIQNLEHLPNVDTVHDGVKINPQARMRKVWGEDFRSYTIVPNPTGSVPGVIWNDLTQEERQLIQEWELIPWGWFKDVPSVSVRAIGLYTCCTEAIGDGQGYDQETGFIERVRPLLLIPEEAVAARARQANKEFFSR